MGISGKNNKKSNFIKTNFDPNRTVKSPLADISEAERQKMDFRRNLVVGIVIIGVVVVFFVLAMFGIGVDDTATGNIFLSSGEVNIAFFGDSITEGYTVDEDGNAYIVETAYPETAKEELLKIYPDIEMNFYNYGISGDIGTETSYERVEEDVNIAIVLYMVNNFIYGEEYEGILEANVQGLAKTGAAVILVNYPVCDGSEYEDLVEECNAYIEQVSEDLVIDLIDADDFFETEIEAGNYTFDELFASDGLHLSEEGYNLLGQIIAGVLETYEVE